MKKSRRVLSLIIALVMTASLAGCGGDSGTSKSGTEGEESGPKTLRMMVWGNTDNETKTTQAVLDAIPELKEKVDIEVEVGGANDAEVANKLRLAFSANEDIPDIVMLNYTQIPELAEEGVLADISEAVEPYEEDIIPGVMNVMQYNGKMVAFPYDCKPKYWFYRKDMFDEAGINVEEVKTIDDFIAAGKKLQEKFPDSYIWNLGSSSSLNDLEFTLTGFGATFKNDEGEYIIDQDAGIKETFEAFKKIKDSGVVGSYQTLTPEWEQAIQNNSLASTLTASWFKVFLPNIAPDLAGKWGVAPWPECIEAGGNAAVFVIPEQSENKELAMEFLSNMRFTKEGSMAVYDALSLTPVIKSCIDEPAVNEPNEYLGVSMSANDFAAFEDFKTFPYTETSSQEFNILLQYLDQYLGGAMSLDEALEAAQNDMETTIADLQ